MICRLSFAGTRADIAPIPVTGKERKIDGIRRQWRIPKWRAAVDEDGQYSFAVAL
jgi:hypothetical protein